MEIALVVVGMAVVGLLVLEGWFLLRLADQNGRLLLRVEALEAHGALGHGTGEPELPAGLPVGSLAPDFRLPDLVGRLRHLRELLDQPRVLIFFNPNCGFCMEMAPRLGQLPDGGERVLLIGSGDPAEHRRLAAEHGWKCTVLLQQNWEVSSAYRASGTPTGYVLDAEGQIASELAIGAEVLIDLAASLPATHGSNGHEPALTAGTIRQKQRATAARAQAAGLAVTKSRLNREGLPAGTQAPDFRLPDLAGVERSLADFRGRRVLLVFSDPNCGPCQALVPQLTALERQSREDLQIVMIGRGAAEANRAKAQEHGVAFPVLLQKRWEISKEYGIFATPVAYLIDEGGIIAEEVAIGTDAIMRLATAASSTISPNGHHAGSTAELLSQKG